MIKCHGTSSLLVDAKITWFFFNQLEINLMNTKWMQKKLIFVANKKEHCFVNLINISMILTSTVTQLEKIMANQSQISIWLPSLVILFYSFKDVLHPTYIIMLCKHWTSMISANFFRNACVKNKKIVIFFFLQLMNNNVWIPQNLNYRENLTIFKIWWIFLTLEGGWICCSACSS